MKVTDFINSKSIAQYLDGLNYQFNAAEAAFIVWQSKHSMRKKYKAWEEIVETYPDMPFEKRNWGIEKDEPSFLAILKNYIQLRKGRKAFPYNCDPFEGMWFQFPTPFKVGDIVYQGNRFVYSGEEDREPFVLLDMASWGEKELRKNGYTDEDRIQRLEGLVRRHLKEGDITDMLSAGYFVDGYGRMFREHTLCRTYLDLEYYDGELSGVERFLTALSNYVQKKIDIAMLANAYRIITDETRVEYIKKYTGCAYFDEQLKLAGLK